MLLQLPISPVFLNTTKKGPIRLPRTYRTCWRLEVNSDEFPLSPSSNGPPDLGPSNRQLTSLGPESNRIVACHDKLDSYLCFITDHSNSPPQAPLYSTPAPALHFSFSFTAPLRKVLVFIDPRIRRQLSSPAFSVVLPYRYSIVRSLSTFRFRPTSQPLQNLVL